MRLLLGCFWVVWSLSITAHSGRTDSNGGHNCSAKSQDKGLCSGYHYHNGGSSPTKPVIEPAPVVGPYSTLYEREDWPHWVDEDRDCQDTRAEILIARSAIPVTFRNDKQCSVTSGSWFDPFSGKTWSKPSDVHIDHIVPLKWAHGHGGQNWSRDKKREFANDWENLLIVEDNLNQAKGAKSPDEWLPPNHQYRCEYVKRFDALVQKYELSYIASENRVIQKILSNCQQ